MEATENAWRLVAEPHVSAKKAFWAMDVNMTVHEIELADLALHQVTIDNTEWFINCTSRRSSPSVACLASPACLQIARL